MLRCRWLTLKSLKLSSQSVMMTHILPRATPYSESTSDSSRWWKWKSGLRSFCFRLYREATARWLGDGAWRRKTLCSAKWHRQVGFHGDELWCRGDINAPVRDTMKRGAQGQIEHTVERADLWHAASYHRCSERNLSVECIERSALKQGVFITTREALCFWMEGFSPAWSPGVQIILRHHSQ